MRLRNSGKGKTPLGPPLHPQGVCWRVPRSFAATLPRTGGKQEQHVEHSCEKGVVTSPPLLRGGREGLAFTPYNKNLTALARENRKHPTLAESKLWYLLLRMRNFSGYKFTRQKPIANFIVDFYSAELHLVLEIDGDSHAESISYDLQRTQVLNKLGIVVFRYSNDEVLNNIDGVYDDLASKVMRLKVHDGGVK